MATPPQTNKISTVELNEVKIKRKTHYRSGKTMFFSFFWKQPFRVSISLIFTIISALFTVLPALFIGTAIDVLSAEGFNSTFWFWCFAIIAISLVNIFTLFISMYLFSIVVFAYERDIRQEFFDVIQNHSLTFHDEHNSSKLLSMGMTEINQIRMALMMGMRTILLAIFTFIITVAILSQINIIYSQIALVGIIIYLFFSVLYSRRIIFVRNELAKHVGELTEASQEIFRGIEIVRGFSAEQREKINFNKKSTNYAMRNEQEGKMSAFYFPGLILLVLTAIIFSLGVFDVQNGSISTGTMIQALGLLLGLQMINFMLPQALLQFQAGLVNADRIWKIMNWVDPQPDFAIKSNPNINWQDGSIKLENVSFSYTKNGKKALDNINIDLPVGSQVALIGGPGSGKTTILKLLLRLYDPQEGKISIEGVNYVTIPAYDVRKHVAQVEQEIFLFSSSIKENISFARTGASDEEIMNAAKAAQAHEFIDKMPDKYDTVIGERGFTLSGGQRQRLAIARAILANPNLLLLDDSASAIDAKTEYLLRTALQNLMANRTSITITQRLNTLVRADIILLLEKGKLIAQGTHKELLNTCKPYQKIFELLPESEQISNIEGGSI